MKESATFFETQPVVLTQLLRSLKHERLAHAYLFEGDNGTGKHEVALWLTQAFFCLEGTEGQPCEACNNCRRIAEGVHPDVIIVEPDGQSIKVEQIRNLQAEFAKSGFESKSKVFILKDAEKMNSSAANSLLKFLEEPSGKILAILETAALGRILPTIQSRCQVIHFQALSADNLQKKLVAAGISSQNAGILTALTNSFEKAVEISQKEWFNEVKESVCQWFDYLSKKDPQAFVYIQKKLLKVLPDKERQNIALTLLMYFFQQHLQELVKKNQKQEVIKINQQLHLILEAEQKLAANVAFQGVTEQLTIRILGWNTQI
ncbi:DNA polymerase-3 subunit delta' [Enterococcus sp. PF1-24]|uniref:DNA polymerase III subunit delta' n=1 Tax=unclassified Enterococcus TaxID=2608891 RepID=UPI00247307B7|nr:MULTISPECIES: DNA polymerase III subunit delta' [unclassified Enterococcus]MDH6364783.1 DNA polymerase-3 subunit delta' [Enterococcus sp. PFB1-1]MDH6401872.1 DNA polymerase-3 subunit delta' [Enterococcus sp. PF1-24]